MIVVAISGDRGGHFRAQKKFEAKAKDRPSRGQGQEHRPKCSQKKSLQNFFSGNLKKKDLKNIFSGEIGHQKIF